MWLQYPHSRNKDVSKVVNKMELFSYNTQSKVVSKVVSKMDVFS